MSFFGKIDKSTTGSVIKKVARLHTRPSKLVDKPVIEHGQVRRHTRRFISTYSPASFDFENWFIGALVGAGQCTEHTRPRAVATTSRRFKQLQSPQSRGILQHSFLNPRRAQHTSSCEVEAASQFDQAQLHGLVDQYDTPYDAEAFARDVYEISPGQDLIVSNKPDDVHFPTTDDQWVAVGHGKEVLDQLQKALLSRNLHPKEVYELYRELPGRRVLYLTPRLRHRLLRHLSTVERKDEPAMLRYLSVVDDCKINGIPLSVAEWNSAISFVATYVSKTTGNEVEAALAMFKEMEQEANVSANPTTFNILFDAATKAGKYHLAEMIYKEMESRGFNYNRFHHVSLIFYFGMREDGEGVRKAYKAMVDAGEIIDTVAMNAVMVSLIRAKEPQAAMQVYKRMVQLHSINGNAKPPERDYKKQKVLDRSLVRIAKKGVKNPEVLEEAKAKIQVAPDIQTYKILINYYAVEAGQLQQATKLIDEMSWFGIPVHGSIFLALLHGFAKHGGEMYSYWTAERLESVWASFMKSRGENVYIGKWVVIWSLQAFAKCAGLDRAREVWNDIQHEWRGTDEEMDHVRKILHDTAEKYGKQL